MSTNNQKYLVLRGKNKDIYFIQKRLSKEQAAIFGKEFIKKSLETKDLNEAIQKRDEILRNLDLKSIEEEKTASDDVDIVPKNDFYSTLEENMGTSIENQQNFNLNSSHNVPINKKNDNHHKNDEKYSIFSLKLPKIPEKEDLIVKVDKIIPIAIVIVSLFIALIA